MTGALPATSRTDMIWLRLAPYLAILAIVGIALYYRGEMIDASAAQRRAEAELRQAEIANAAALETIERITRMRQADDKILLDLTNEIARLNEVATETQATITELERTNEDVRSYLAGAIPDDLRRVLNKQ